MTDNKTGLLTCGGICLLIGVFGLVSPLASTTFASIMQRSTELFQAGFAFLTLIGGVCLYFGIRAKSGS